MQNHSNPFTRGKSARNYAFRQEAGGDSAELLIYDVIGSGPFGGIGSKQVIEDLSASNASEVHVRINSPGGDAFEGQAIFNALRRFQGRVITHIDSLAASAAATIAMAGEEVHISENAFLMIHKSWGGVLGNEADMAATAEVLRKLDSAIARIYSSRTGKTEHRILQMMADETWFTAREARAEGFCDRITDKVEARNKFDLSMFQRVPKSLDGEARRDAGAEPAKYDLESALRDAGFSRSQAKTVVSRCNDLFSQRDAGADEAAIIAALDRARSILAA